MAKDDEAVSPWLQGVAGIKGVVPPGRRLSDEARPNKWSASGVRGVRPPGNAEVGSKPPWAETPDKRASDARRRQAELRKGKNKTQQGRPTDGVQPDLTLPLDKPKEFRKFLSQVEDHMRAHPMGLDNAEDFAIAIRQSHAPFQIVIGFTGLSMIVAEHQQLRRKLSTVLERGAMAYFNLAQRIDDSVKVPKGLHIETLDPLFWDMPRSFTKIPYAWATDAFCQLLFLFRHVGDEPSDRALIAVARQLRDQHINGRSFGDRSLETLFAWEEPDWVPPED